MGEFTDLIISILGYVGKWFNSQGKRLCFIFWGLCLAYWFARNIQLSLMVQTGGTFISFLFNAYSFWNWGKKGIGK